MTPEVKQRIEQIRQGIVPKGYRKTIFGIAPMDWSMSRISEISKLSSGSTPRRDNADNFDGDILWITSGELKQRNILDTRERISEAAAQSSHLEMYNPGTVVIAIYGLEAGGIRGTASIIGKRCTISQACMAFTELKDIDYEFFYYWYINNGQVIGLRYAQGTKQQNLSTDIVGAFPICYPLRSKQRKIVEILSTQDKAIELQEHIIEELKRFKRVCLEKMFPRKGQKVPEKRFPGFTGDWERRKLGEILQTLPFAQFLRQPERDGEYEIIQQGNEPIMGFANGTPCEDYENTVIFGDHTLSLYKPCKPFFIATDGVRIIKGKQNINGYFLFTLLERYKPQSEGYKRYYSILADCECHITKDRHEQQKIGDYFRNLNHLITLHQRKLEEMKKQKKALMQLLLTGIVRV